MKTVFLRICLLGILFLSVSSQLTYAQENDMKTDVGITRGRNIHLWPIFYRDKSEVQKKVEVAASLFQYKRELGDTTVHSHLFPLYVYDSSRARKDIRMGSLYYPSLFRYSYSAHTAIKSFKLLEVLPNVDLLEFTRSAQGDYLQNNLLFFLWYKNNRTDSNSHFVVFPIWWRYKNPYDRYTLFFPLFSHHRDVRSQITHTWVFPSFYYVKRPEQKRIGVWPLYFHSSDSINRTNVLFPVVWSYKKQFQHSFSLFPLFIYGKDSQSLRSYFALTPFIWNVSKPNYRFQAVFPLAWRKNEKTPGKEGKRTALFPLFFYKKSNELTIEYRHKRIEDSLMYYKDTLHTAKRNVTLFPIAWDFKTEVYKDDSLYKSSRYTEIIPFYGKGSTCRSRDSFITTYSNVGPLYWQFKNRVGVQRILFPLWWYQKQKTSYGLAQKTANVLFPFFWHHTTKYLLQDSVSRSSTVLFPVWWYLKRPDATYHAFIPFYFYTKNKKDSSSAWALTPLYISVRQKQKSNTILFLLFHAYRSPEKHYTTLFPLFSYKCDSSRLHTQLVVSPFFWKMRDDSVSRTTFFPLFRHEQDVASRTTRDNIGILLYRSEKTDSTRTQHVLWPFIGWSKARKEARFHFFPMVWYKKGIDPFTGPQSTCVLTPLFWKTLKDSVKTTLLFPLFYHQKEVPTQAVRSSIAGILYRYTKKDSVESRQFLWPFIGYTKSSRQFSYHVAPFVWYKKSQEKRTVGVFPLYHSVKKESTHSHHFLWPLYTFKKMTGVYKAHAVVGPVLRVVKMENGTHDVRFLHLVVAHSTLQGKVVKSYFPLYITPAILRATFLLL